jgi:hypothetical protein
MSRILRRPMFRGGSTSNEGIMSVPRKGYEKAGGVQDFDVSNYYPSSSSVDGGLFGNNEDAYNEYVATSNKDESLSINPKFVKSEVGDIKQKNKTYKALGQEIEEGSYGDVLLKEYLGNRSDPMGKFLINFGLNYMSARPRGGKFGALATAADAAKKPTEQLYADVDTDRLLKLKLMSAIGKSDSKVALEKEARLLVEQYPERYPDMKTALAELMRIRAEKKTLTPDERIAAREKSFELDQPLVKRAKAKLFEFGLPKLGKEEKNVDMNNTFINQGDLVQKQNSTDAQLVKPPQNIEKTFKTGKIYIDLESRNAYKYVGPNTFRFVTSLE